MVFISFAREDLEFVTSVAAFLVRGGHQIWMYTERKDHHVEIPAAIVDALERSKVMVVMVTASANDSYWVADEVQLAKHYKIPIIAVYHGIAFEDLKNKCLKLALINKSSVTLDSKDDLAGRAGEILLASLPPPAWTPSTHPPPQQPPEPAASKPAPEPAVSTPPSAPAAAEPSLEPPASRRAPEPSTPSRLTGGTPKPNLDRGNGTGEALSTSLAFVGISLLTFWLLGDACDVWRVGLLAIAVGLLRAAPGLSGRFLRGPTTGRQGNAAMVRLHTQGATAGFLMGLFLCHADRLGVVTVGLVAVAVLGALALGHLADGIAELLAHAASRPAQED